MDARLHYSSNAFESMEEWIIKTIDFYSDKEGFNLIIRIHPAEITEMSRLDKKLRTY